jgi:AcrR family transcriptional regulator
LTPEARRARLLDAAGRLIVVQGFLPLNMERLAVAAGVSKALVYSYFATPHDLYNVLLEREMTGLLQGGLATASRVADLDQASLLCAMFYFEYVCRCGPLLHILLSDRYMAGRVAPRALQMRDSLRRRLTRLAGRTLRLSKREILAAIEMIIAIPEEAGRLVFHREIDAAVARQTCHSLVVSSLHALRAPERILTTEQVT